MVIGGTSLAGGVGTVVGSMIGALTLSILDNILGLRNVQSEYQAILKGSSSSWPSLSSASGEGMLMRQSRGCLGIHLTTVATSDGRLMTARAPPRPEVHCASRLDGWDEGVA